MGSPRPKIGDWYQTPEGDHLEVVAYDPDELTVEVQFFDGAIDEYDLDTWNELSLESAAPPEDWSGSLDLVKEDYGVDLDLPTKGPASYTEEYEIAESEFDE